MNNLHQQYKRETGNSVTETEFGVVRRRGIYILDPQEVNDEFVFQCLGNSFYITIPDLAYINWMEEKIEEMQKPTKKV
jgi:hypothetical protein